jgi:hypothetical protein
VIVLLTTNGGSNQLALTINGTTADINLHTNATISGMSFGICVVDVSTQGVQRSTALFVVLATGDLSATDTTTDGDLDTLSAGTHSAHDSVLDGATILHAALNLLGNILGNQDGIQLGALHLGDVDLDVLASKFLQFFLQLVNLGTSLADNQTWTGGIDGDGEEFKGSLDVDFRDAGLSETDIEVLTDFVVLNELLLESATTVPVRIPSADNA